MSKILDLKKYDLVFTTSFFYTHGVSGHLYELIDYFYICTQAGLKCCILLSDGVAKPTLIQTIKDKYNFTETEINQFELCSVECHKPKIVMAQNICIVDGSWRVLDCTMYANNMFLLRCSNDEFEYFSNSKTIKKTHLLQDFKLYPERYDHLNIEVIDYVKKILWSKYKHPTAVKTDTALLYLTTSTRAIPVEEVERIIARQYCPKHLIITNDVNKYKHLASDTVFVECAPVDNVFERFDTYVYTATKWKTDCSPRFVVECALYNKSVVYEIDYHCAGLERRKEDIKNCFEKLELHLDDEFVSYVKCALEEVYA